MKTWGSRIKWAGAAIALSAVLLCCALFSFVFLNKKEDKTANAGTLNHASVGELLVDATKAYNDSSKDFFSRLGGTGTSYASLKAVVDADPNKQLTAQDIRDKNEGRNVLVQIGGIQWTVAYVSENTSGEVVATLYMADSADIKTSYGATSNYYDSNIRKILTGLGGSTLTQNDYFKNIIDLITNVVQLPSGMTSWQNISLNCGSGQNIGNDPLWVPSSDEALPIKYNGIGAGTGPSENLWKLDDDQRVSTVATKILLRTTFTTSGTLAEVYAGVSGSLNNAYLATPYYLRPAFHLNLKKVDNLINTDSNRLIKDIDNISFNSTAAAGKIFTSSKLDDLRTYLTVTLVNVADPGNKFSVSDYRLLGNLSSPGTRTITVIVRGFERTFTVNVTGVTLTKITATYEQGNNAFDSDSTADELRTKGTLTVTEHYNDGSTKPCTAYTLSGTISGTGQSPITVHYSGFTATVYVSASSGAVGTVYVTYNQTGTVYPTTPLSELKNLGTIYARVDYSDGTVMDNVHLRSDFKLFGTLADSGECDIFASYDGKAGTFKVNVTALALTGISVKTQPDKKAYTAYDRFDTAGMEIEAAYNDGSEKTVYGYNFVYAGGNESFRTGESKITISYTEGGVTKTVDVTGITVAKAPLTVTVNNQFLDCGESIPSSGYGVAGISVSGLKNGENLTELLGGLLNYKATGYNPASSANGTYTLTIDPITLAEYSVTVVSGKLNVGVKVLDVTLTVTNGVYGGASVTALATAKDGGTVVSGISFEYTYSGTAYDGTVYTDSTAVPTKAGEYTVTANISTDGYTGFANRPVKIARKAITASAGGMSVTSKTYDGNAVANIVVNSFTGKVGSDVITLTVTGEFADKNVGSGKIVNITGYALDAASLNNYFIDTANCATQLTGNITKKDVTAVITAGDCVYGGVPSVTYAVTGAVAGENILLDLSYLNGTDSTTVLKNAGVYTVTAVLTSEFAGNYNLAGVTLDGGTAGDPVEVEITKAPLTITVYDAEVAYGGGKVNNGAFVTGLVWSDTRASLSIENSDLNFIYGDFDTDNGAVGTYVLSVDNSVLNLANYTITVVDGTLTVGLKNVTVTLTVTNGIYGGTGANAAGAVAAASDGLTAVTPTIKITYSGTSYDGTVYSNSTTIPVKPGEYEVTATVDTASGYTGTASSLMKISRASLTVTVSAATAGTTDKAEYGTEITNANLKTRYTLTYSGWVNDDEKDSFGNPTLTGDIVPANAKWSTDYFRYAPVGNYSVIVSGLTSDNYELTYVNGVLTVEKANATVTLKNQSSVYDGNIPVAGNAVNVDFTVIGLKRTADDLGVSVAIANAAKDAGTYDLEASASNGNYNVTFAGETAANTATDNNGVWTIAGAYTVNKAKLTITADDKTITYGDGAPVYTAIYVGFIGADGTAAGPAAGIFSTELALGCAYVQFDAANGNAGAYDITEATAAVADNYDITFVKGKLTVERKAITVNIDRSKTVSEYGKTPLDFSVNTSDYYSFNTTDLAQSADDLLITLSHGVTTASNAGTYVITAVSGNANYEVTFTDCVYTVEQYKITVEWVVENDDGTETAIAAGDIPQFVYNGANQGPKAYFNMPGGKISVSAGNISGLQKNAGTGYAVTVVIPTEYKGNYTFDASARNTQAFEITARQLTITWTAAQKDADGVFYFEFNEGIQQHPTATFGNVVSGETVTPVYVGATGLVCASHTVEVQITDKNYSLPSNSTVNYYIVQMPLNSFFWTYDGTNNINASTYSYTYDGKTHMPTAMAGVSVTFSYVLTYSDGTDCGNRAVNAGEYTVTAVPSNASYKIPDGSSNKFTFTIAPKEIKSSEVYYDTLTFEYTGYEQKPEFWYTDINGARIYLNADVSGEHKVAATYTAEISAPSDKNYTFTGNAANYTKQYTIAPKDIEVEWILNDGEWVTDFVDDYNGSAVNYSANAKMTSTYAGELNKIGLKFEVTRKDGVSGASSVWTGDIRDAGIYTLRVYVSDKNLASNYNVKEFSRQITIDRLPLQIKVNGGNDYNVNYNDAAPGYTADFSGFAPVYTDASGNSVDESVTVKAAVESVEQWIFSRYVRGAQPGSYDVTLTTDGDKLKLLRQILRNYDWEGSFTGVKIIVNSVTGTVLVLADNGTNEFVYDGTVKLPEAFYTPTTGNGQQRKLDVSLLSVNPDGSVNEYLTDGKAINVGTYYISVKRVSGDNDLTELLTDGLYFKIIKRTVIVKISDREVDYGEVTQDNRGSHIVTEYLSSYGGRNGYLPLASDEAGLAIDVDCRFLKSDGTGNYDGQGYAQAGEYLIEGTWNSDYSANYEVIFVGSEDGVNGQFSAGAFIINKADITVISNGDTFFEEYGDFDSSNPRYVIKLADKTDRVYNNIIYSGNKRPGNTDAQVTIKYVDKQLLADAEEPKHDAEYYLTDAPRITAAGDWIIYYFIEVAGGNHNKYYGAWRVQIRPEEDFIIVVFEKEFTVPYGDGVPEDLTEQLYEGGYYRMGNNAVSKEWFRDNATAYVAGVSKTSEVGLYNIYFTIKEDAVTGSLEYLIKYTDSNYTPETNIGKYRIEQRLLTVNWSEESEFEHDGEVHLPGLSITGWLDGGTLTPDGLLANGERRYIYKDGEKQIVVTVTAEGDFKQIGGHAVEVSVGNSNYRIDVKNAVKSISIKSDTVVEYGHLPAWAWYAIGGGAAVLALAIVILAVKLKHRKPITEGGDDDGFYDNMSDDETI